MCPTVPEATPTRGLRGRQEAGIDRQFPNPGREWQPQGSALSVGTHDFRDNEMGVGNPYGVYDLTRNDGWVSVGSITTARSRGRKRHPCGASAATHKPASWKAAGWALRPALRGGLRWSSGYLLGGSVCLDVGFAAAVLRQVLLERLDLRRDQ